MSSRRAAPHVYEIVTSKRGYDDVITRTHAYGVAHALDRAVRALRRLSSDLVTHEGDLATVEGVTMIATRIE